MNCNKCANCGKETDKLQKHHIVPLVLGGNDVETNIIYLCDKCHGLIHNIQYGNKTLSHSELTKKGLEKAKKQGKHIGIKKGTKLITKKSIKAKSLILQYNFTFNGNKNNVETIEILENLGCKISRPTFYRYKKELMETQNGCK